MYQFHSSMLSKILRRSTAARGCACYSYNLSTVNILLICPQVTTPSISTGLLFLCFLLIGGSLFYLQTLDLIIKNYTMKKQFINVEDIQYKREKADDVKFQLTSPVSQSIKDRGETIGSLQSTTAYLRLHSNLTSNTDWQGRPLLVNHTGISRQWKERDAEFMSSVSQSPQCLQSARISNVFLGLFLILK